MNNELYFIPILEKALLHPAPESALRDAFAQVEAMGRDPALRVGHRQFHRFMNETRRALMEDARGETPLRALSECERPTQVALWLERDGRRIAELVIDRLSFKHPVTDLQPGNFRLSTDTGWTLWEATLTPRQLIWSAAFPGQSLPLAAQTGQASPTPSMEVSLLEGAVTLRAYPGLEGGLLSIAVQDRRPRS